SSTPAVPPRCARRAAATFLPLAASSKAQRKSCPPESGLRCAPWQSRIDAMDALPRLLLRFIIVPVGYFAGVLAGTLVILFGSWKIGRIDSFDVEARAIAIYGYAFAAPVLLVILLSVMWLPTAIGILLSEVVALRSWMFHAGNGALS